MVAFGCGTLVSRLIAKGLLDERELFGNLDGYEQLRLLAAKPFDYGITALHFESKRS